jgi:transposase
MPWKEAKLQYNLGHSTLTGWMLKYGSSAYKGRKRKKMSPLERSKIIADIEQGRLTTSEAQKKYNRSLKTIQKLIYNSRRENSIFCHPINKSMAKNKQGPSTNNQETQSIQRALEEANLKIKALNTMIDIAEEQLKIDIRKNSGTKQSK